MKKKISDSFIILFSGWLLFLTTLTLFLIKNDFRSVNSDFMYLPVLYNDLVYWGGSLSDWKLTPAPYFFPDMTMFFIFEKIFGNFNISMVAAGVLQTLLFILGWVTLGKAISFSRESKIHFQTIILLISSGIMTLGFLKPTAIQHLILTQHFGIMVLVPYILISGIMIVRESGYKSGMKYASALFILTFLGGVSDANIVFQTVVPLAAVSCIMFLSGFIKFGQAIVLSMTPVFGSLAGIIVNKIVIKYPSIDQYMANMNLAKINGALNVFIVWFGNWIQTHLFVGILVLSALFMNLLGCLFLYRKYETKNELRKEVWFLNAFCFFSVLICIFSMIVTGTFSDSKGIDRYLFPLTVLQLYSLAIWGGFYFKKQISKKVTGIFVLITLLIFMYSFPKLPYLKKYTDYYPPEIKRLDMEISKRGLKNGIDHYWDAKYLTMLSKHDLKILQVTPDFLPYHWISNIRWYQKFPPEFIIIDPEAPSGHEISEKSIIDKFGAPSERFECGRRTVYVYKRPGDTLKLIKDYPIAADLKKKGMKFTYYALFLPGIIGKAEGAGRFADKGETGYITYGPPVKLTHGDFKATIFYCAIPQNISNSPGQWDIGFQKDKDFVIVRNGDLIPDKQFLSAEFPVDKSEFVEIRTLSNGTCRLRIDKIVLERIR